MKKKFINTNLAILILSLGSMIATLTSCSNNSDNSSTSKAEIDSLRTLITQLTANDETIAKNLATFDTLDYTVFSNQEWTRLHESHAKDIKVNWPDGHFTTGIDKHIEDLKAMFVYAPDTRV